MRALLFLVLASACGRIGFDASASSSTGDGGASGLTLSYPRSTIAAVLGATTVSLVPTVSDPAARFTVQPAFPTGIALDAVTGAITGTPAQAGQGTYVVTAARGSEVATAALELIALPGWVVDSTADAPDANGGTDTTCAAAGGGCTLRAAIQTANHQTTKQLVLLAAADYALGSALDPITDDIVIVGAGARLTTIRAATVHAAYPALTVATVHALSLRDLAIADFGGTNGGALAVTAGSLDVDRCAFTNNASPGSGGVLYITGGATATFVRSTFTGNASLGGSGGGWGGVIDGEGTNTAIVVRQSTATQNTTAWGSFSHITTGTTLRLENSTLYANTSTTAGTLATPGGVYTIVNSTIVRNTNTNTTADSAGVYLYSAPCHYTLANTLVAFNTDKTGAEHNCNIRDVTTSITSNGGNIFSDGAGNCAMYLTMPGDRLSTDPGVEAGAPSDHGGLTATLLLANGGPALDGGEAADCPAIDQRGKPRPAGAACDVGAVEMP